MKTLLDPRGYLAEGLKRLRAELDLADGFDEGVLAEAREAAGRQPGDHRDRTDWPFVTLDPASSTDLDQAFHPATIFSALRHCRCRLVRAPRQ